MPHDAPLEAHEHMEHAEHASHEADPFVGKVSITIAVLAVMAATAGSLETIESGKAITTSADAVLKQDQATDNWGFANSKAVRKNLYLIATDLNPGRAADYKKSQDKNAKDEDSAHEKAVDLEKEREALVKESQAHEGRHHWLTGAATLIEVGIAVCTVAIITKRRAFWYGSIALGLGGLALMGVAFLPMG
jgi:hypothetical protein